MLWSSSSSWPRPFSKVAERKEDRPQRGNPRSAVHCEGRPAAFVRGWLAALALSGLVAGCTTLGPDFHPLKSSELSRWDQKLYQLAEPEPAAAEADLHAWWKQFHDPVLERLIGMADKENLQLRQAGMRILQARALLGIAGASRYPQSRLGTGDYTYFHQKEHGGQGGSTSYSSFQAGLAAGWELDFWGRFRRSIESADAGFLASLEAQRALQVLIKAQVASLYFNWRVLGKRIAIARKNAELQKRSLQIARELYQSGNTSELDLQQARTQYLSTLSVIPELQRQRRQTLNSLALTLGRSPGDLPELHDDPDYRLPRVENVVVRDIPARLLLRRPDVHAAAWAVAARSARIGVAEADLYPAISLLGSLGWSSSTLSGVSDTSLLTIGPSFRWNLFDHGLIRNNVRLQDARLQEALEAYRQTVLTAAREIDDAAIGLVKTIEQEKIMEQTVNTAKRALQIAHTSYREGYTDFQRVLDAQRSLFTQNDRLASIRGATLAYLVALYKGLGGGWKPAALEEMVPNTTREQMKQRTDWGDLLDQPLPVRLPSPVQPPDSQETP